MPRAHAAPINLLRGFGEAGANVIEQNMRGIDSALEAKEAEETQEATEAREAKESRV